GGGGLVAARHLANHGVDVAVTVAKPESPGPVPSPPLDIVGRMSLWVTREPRPADVVIDALIGYSLRGPPRGRIGQLIDGIQSVSPIVVSLDTPSGLDVTDGSTPGPVVTADGTLTLALPKIGLRSAPQVGELYIADISVPPAVYGPLGVGPAPPFGSGPIIRCVPGETAR
ncbi:MAG: NAD(P)H-hydrate epimerase, partial [Acidimicrobiales bacterium]